jgi:integrase
MACVRKWRGKWVVDWRDETSKRHIEAVEGDRETAEGRLAEIIKGGKKPVNNKQTFTEYAAWWLENCAQGNIKDSTLDEYKAVLNNHVYPAFGSRPLARVTRKMVREFIALKKKAGFKKKAALSRSTIKNILAPVRAIYNQAIEDGNVQFNPASNVGKFNKREPGEKQINPFTREELATLLKTARGKMPHFYPALLCAARTGLREGELIGLKSQDIDFHGRFVEVQRTISRGKATLPKNGKTRRVDMSLQLTNTLDELLAKRKVEALKREMEKPSEERRKHEEVLAEVMESWIFTTPIGTQLDPNNLRKHVFYRCLDFAELRRLRFHDLRHTFASLLIQQGESLAYVKDQLGHHSIQITVDTYGHLVPGGNRQAVDRLDDMFSSDMEDEIKESDEAGTEVLAGS